MLARIAFAAVVALSASASAQQPEAEPPAAEPAAAQSPTAQPSTPDPAAAPAPGQQSQALRERALRALSAGDLEGAARAFDEIATTAADPGEAAFARDLAARVRRMAVEKVPPLVPGPGDAMPPRKARKQDARAAYLAVTTLHGLAVWGWAAPAALGVDPDDNLRPFIGLYMVTGAAAFAGPYFLTRERHPSWGETNLAFWGGTRGIELGVLVGALAFGDQGDDFQARSAAMLVGSVAGLVGGTFWARGAEMTPGHARSVALAGDVGGALGFGLGHLFRLDEKDTADAEARGMSAVGLAGATVGLVGGHFYARARQNTWGDGEVMRATTALGAFAGLTLADLGDADTSRPVVASMMAGGVAGAVAGDLLVRTTDFSVGQSLVIEFATVAGGLAGAGTTYLALGDEGSSKVYLSAASIGAAVGLGLTYWAFHDEPDDARTAAIGRALRRGRVAVLPAVGPDQRGLTLAGAF